MNSSRRNRGKRGSGLRNQKERYDPNNSRQVRGFVTPETKSFAYGVGVGVLAMILFPQLKDNLKGVTVGAVQGVSNLAEKVQEAVSQVKEGFEDIVAEAKFENLKNALEKEIMGDSVEGPGIEGGQGLPNQE